MNYAEEKDQQCECFILNTRDQHIKFDSKVDKGIFLGYSDTSKAYSLFNSRTFVMEESIHVKFNDSLTIYRQLLDIEDDFAYMHIGLSIALKIYKVKQSDEIPSQFGELSRQ